MPCARDAACQQALDRFAGTFAEVNPDVAVIFGNDPMEIFPEESGGRGRDRTGDPLLAKQVLSQLSYTPTVGTLIDFKAIAPVRKLRNSTFTLYCVRTVSKPLSPEPCCVKTPDISLARRLILSNASLFICNFIWEYFLNTWESP